MYSVSRCWISKLAAHTWLEREVVWLMSVCMLPPCTAANRVLYYACLRVSFGCVQAAHAFALHCTVIQDLRLRAGTCFLRNTPNCPCTTANQVLRPFTAAWGQGPGGLSWFHGCAGGGVSGCSCRLGRGLGVVCSVAGSRPRVGDVSCSAPGSGSITPCC